MKAYRREMKRDFVMFKTELHCHSAEVSDCGRLSAKELAERYIESGYTTVVLTNHLSKYTYKNKRFDHSDWDWNKKIDHFMNGFHLFEDAARGRLHVILGCELRLNRDGGNDYLLQGVTEELLRSFPDMMDAHLEDVREELHAVGGLLYQAHPFRNGIRITPPVDLDGIEVYNGHFEHDSRNWIASQWAERYGLMRSSGSDIHTSEHIISGGIETEAPITTREELVAALRSPTLSLLTAPIPNPNH